MKDSILKVKNIEEFIEILSKYKDEAHLISFTGQEKYKDIKGYMKFEIKFED